MPELGDKDQPEPIPGPIREIQRKLDQLALDLEAQAAHTKSAIDLYHQILREMQEIFPRLERVERKTFALSDTPRVKNCPNCQRKLANPKAAKCPICGHEVY